MMAYFSTRFTRSNLRVLQKPECLKVPLKVDYCAIQIPNDFIVGYGLDYNGMGRNYRDIYKVVDD